MKIDKRGATPGYVRSSHLLHVRTLEPDGFVLKRSAVRADLLRFLLPVSQRFADFPSPETQQKALVPQRTDMAA